MIFCWTTLWKQDPCELYAHLTKAESTALFLMRTEIIGLDAWLAAIQVPNITPACEWLASVDSPTHTATLSKV